MRKILITICLVVFASGPLLAQNITNDKEVETVDLRSKEGQAKLGVLVGLPASVTFGYRFSNWFELNFLAGWSHYNKSVVALGLNTLFTVVRFPTEESAFLLSIGPQGVFHIGENFATDIVLDIRLEYSFPHIPLNLFAEVGPGIGLDFSKDKLDLYVAVLGGLGVRYIF